MYACPVLSGKLQMITRKTANLYATFGIFIKRNVVDARSERKNKNNANGGEKKRIKNENKQSRRQRDYYYTMSYHRLRIALSIVYIKQ